jgi:hypothetical protein
MNNTYFKNKNEIKIKAKLMISILFFADAFPSNFLFCF